MSRLFAFVMSLSTLGCGGTETITRPDPEPVAPPTAEPLTLADGARDRLMGHVSFLADDARDGRRPGTPGGEAAVRYVAEQFQAIGLEALSEGFTQSFEVPTSVAIDAERTGLRAAGRDLVAGQDFVVAEGSASGEIEAEVVDVGHGIVAPAMQLDDYANREVTGKIVLVRAGAPPSDNPHAGMSQFGSVLYKLRTARERGAAGVIVLSDELTPPHDPVDMGIPAVLLATRHERLLRRRPVSLRVAVQVVRVPAHNVIGVLRGSDPRLAGEVIVVGAHVDHLGRGGEGSRATESDAVHNGADDNASGVALVLETARALASRRGEVRRTVAFIAFDAEEMGILGSAHFVANRPAGLERIVAMINADMVGRLREGRLLAIGGRSSNAWAPLLERASEGLGLRLDTTSSGFGASDQTSFYAQRIPVVHLFTGVHNEYHRPEDDTQLIEADGLVTVTTFASRLALSTAGLSEAPDFVASTEPSTMGREGFSVSLGTIPDYASEVRGVRLTGVRDASPAASAGLRAGDTIVALAGHTITNIHDYVFALRELSAGVSVTIIVDREGNLVEFQVVPVPREGSR